MTIGDMEDRAARRLNTVATVVSMEATAAVGDLAWLLADELSRFRAQRRAAQQQEEERQYQRWLSGPDYDPLQDRNCLGVIHRDGSYKPTPWGWNSPTEGK